jgi:hypothetical protein
MAVEAAAGRLKTEADEPGWEVDPDDEWGVAVIATVGRQLKLRREAVGIRAAEFGTAVGYGEDMVYKMCDLKAAQPSTVAPAAWVDFVTYASES